jgi:hypothetical protein
MIPIIGVLIRNSVILIVQIENLRKADAQHAARWWKRPSIAYGRIADRRRKSRYHPDRAQDFLGPAR